MMSILDPGDEIIVFTPYWPSYRESIELIGARPVLVVVGPHDD